MSAGVQLRDEKREQIDALAEALKEFPQVECETVHRFAKGCYLREIHMPAGSIVIGKIHATQHFNIIISGECRVVTADEDKLLKAGDTFVSEAGVQKCVVNLTDVVWQTVHVTEKTDLKEIEKEVIVKNYQELDSRIAKKLQGGAACLGVT